MRRITLLLGSLLAIGVAFAADPPKEGLQTLLKSSPKAAPADGSFHVVGVQGGAIRQLSYSSIHPPLATTTAPGVVKVGSGLAVTADGTLNNTGISSVNGQQGAVVLGAVDVGADPLGSATSVQSDLDLHAGRIDNPHQVTKDQVGLGLVPNVDATARANHTGTQSADTIVDGAANKAFTAAEKTKLGAISGTNTGDETGATIKSKLGITTLSGSNTGDQDLSGLVPKTTTVNGKALSGNISLSAADVGALQPTGNGSQLTGITAAQISGLPIQYFLSEFGNSNLGATLQSAIDAVSAAGGGEIVCDTPDDNDDIVFTAPLVPKSHVSVDLNTSTLKWAGAAGATMIRNNPAVAGATDFKLFNGYLDPGYNVSKLFELHSLNYSEIYDLTLISANPDTLVFMHLLPDASADSPDGTRNVVGNKFGPFYSETVTYSPVVQTALILDGSNPPWRVTTGNDFVGPWDFATKGKGIIAKQYCDSNNFYGLFRVTLANPTVPGTCVVFNDSVDKTQPADVWGLHFAHLSCETWYPDLPGQKAVEINHAGGILIDYLGNDRVSQNSWPVGMVTDNFSQGHIINYVEGAPSYKVKQYIKGDMAVQGSGNGVIYPDGSKQVSAVDLVNCDLGEHVSSFDPTTGAFSCTADTTTGGDTDPNAIHGNTAGEIAALAQKASPASGDWLIVEDSASGNAKKKVNAGSLMPDPSQRLAVGGLDVSGGNTIVQKAVSASAPTPTATAILGGGSVPAGTYYYVVTAVDASGTESVKGGQASATLTGPGHVDLSWSAAIGAAAYRIYRSTTSGTFSSPSLIGMYATTSAGDQLATPTAGTPPATYTAGNAISLVPTGPTTVKTGDVGIGPVAPTVALHVSRVGASGGIQLDSFNVNPVSANNWSVFGLGQYWGTPEYKTAVGAGQNVGVYRFGAYDGSALSWNAAIFGVTTETQTPSGHGMDLTFQTNAKGSASRTEKMRITGEGTVLIGATSSADTTTKLQVAGNAKATGDMTAATYNGLPLNTYGVYAPAPAGGTFTVDAAAVGHAEIAPTATASLAITGQPASGVRYISIHLAPSQNISITWPSINWIGGTAAASSLTSGKQYDYACEVFPSMTRCNVLGEGY